VVVELAGAHLRQPLGLRPHIPGYVGEGEAVIEHVVEGVGVPVSHRSRVCSLGLYHLLAITLVGWVLHCRSCHESAGSRGGCSPYGAPGEVGRGGEVGLLLEVGDGAPQERSTTVEVYGDTARLVGRIVTDATVYGSRANWRLQLTM
jgi:hypothetical protein